MPKKVAKGSHSLYFECPCMKEGEGVLFKCQKRMSLWKRLHQSKCEYGDCDIIRLKSIGDANFDGNSSLTEYKFRNLAKTTNDSLY